jgi:hypothetical protein
VWARIDALKLISARPSLAAGGNEAGGRAILAEAVDHICAYFAAAARDDIHFGGIQS